MDINTYLPKGKTELRSLVSLKNALPTDIFELLSCAKKLKTLSKYGELPQKRSQSYSVLITTDKLSTTRIAFEIAADSLNIKPIILNLSQSSVEDFLNNEDFAKILGRFPVTSVVFDTDACSVAETAQSKLLIPTICANALTGPCQTLAALLTVWEKKNRLNNLKAVVVTDNATSNPSLYAGMAKCGIDLTIVCSEATGCDESFVKELRQFSKVSVTTNLASALKDCDVIYCENHNLGADYIVTHNHLELTNDALFLQNFNFTRNKQAESKVYDSHNCCIYDVGENMLNVLRASLSLIRN
ncbi:MAG: hypothetical protein ACI4M6_02025 [Christensenellaceae bacterium]